MRKSGRSSRMSFNVPSRMSDATSAVTTQQAPSQAQQSKPITIGAGRIKKVAAEALSSLSNTKGTTSEMDVHLISIPNGRSSFQASSNEASSISESFSTDAVTDMLEYLESPRLDGEDAVVSKPTDSQVKEFRMERINEKNTTESLFKIHRIQEKCKESLQGLDSKLRSSTEDAATGQLASDLVDHLDHLEKLNTAIKSLDGKPIPYNIQKEISQIDRDVKALIDGTRKSDAQDSRIPGQNPTGIESKILSEIKKTHEYDKVFLAKETVSTLDQKKILAGQLKLKISELVGKKGGQASKEMDTQIKKLETALVNLYNDPQTKKTKGSFGSNYQRNHCRENAKKILAANNGEITADQFKDIVDTSSAGLINSRFDVLRGPNNETKVSIFRLGAMTDLRNGSVSTKELEQIIKEKETGESPTEIKVMKRIEKLKAKFGSDPINLASLQMAEKVLQDPSLALSNRKERMETLMFQYLEAQADQAQLTKNTVSNLDENGTWKIADVRLLNPKQAKMEDGCILVEQVMIEDMLAVFEDFDGSTIVFDKDCKATHKDQDGIVHVPAPYLSESKTVKLSAQLLNISIQKYHKNEVIPGSHTQGTINHTSMKRIEDENQDLIGLGERDDSPGSRDWRNANKILANGKTDSTAAECIVSALNDVGVTVSTGCFAAKDRTGLVVGRSMIKNMVKELPKDTQKNAGQVLTAELLEGNSVMMGVINENKKQRAAQVDPRIALKEGGFKAGASQLYRAAKDRISPLKKE